MFRELHAFTEECEAAEATLARVAGDDWERRALGTWSLRELVVHLLRGVTRIDAYLDEDPGGDQPAADRVSYWRFDLAAEAPEIAERARAAAADIDPGTLADRFAAGWRASAERASALPPGRLMSTLRGPMRLDEYVATRVVEVVVHHMDVCATLDLPPVSTPAAGRLTMGILEGLLGSRRPRNMGRARFIMAATGRIPTDDERLPVLS